MGVTVFHIIFPHISHIHSECGEYAEILCGILSLPHNIVMNMNNAIIDKILLSVCYCKEDILLQGNYVSFFTVTI